MRDRERTVPYIPGIYQNDRNEKLSQKKIHAHGHAPRTKLSLYYFRSNLYQAVITEDFFLKIKRAFRDLKRGY